MKTHTRDEARKYWGSLGLTYSDVTEGDIIPLIMLLNKELKISNKTCETSIDNLHLSKKISFTQTPKHTMKTCYLYINSDYFIRRECISFNSDGFIGFAGWAADKTIQPILRAFIQWCDLLKQNKEAIDGSNNG